MKRPNGHKGCPWEYLVKRSNGHDGMPLGLHSDIEEIEKACDAERCGLRFRITGFYLTGGLGTVRGLYQLCFRSALKNQGEENGRKIGNQGNQGNRGEGGENLLKSRDPYGRGPDPLLSPGI